MNEIVKDDFHLIGWFLIWLQMLLRAICKYMYPLLVGGGGGGHSTLEGASFASVEFLGGQFTKCSGDI